MKNAPAPRISNKGLAPSADKQMLAVYVGFQDVMAGYGFRKEYDTWTRTVQHNYERGRTIAVTVKREFGFVHWDKNQILSVAMKRAFGTRFNGLVPKIMSDVEIFNV